MTFKPESQQVGKPESSQNPADKTYRLIGSLREHMSRYGYEVIDLPIIEDADLFLIKAGDQLIHQLFTFERQGREFALRPEFTAAAAYRYITNDDRPSTVRWQFNGSVFVDDPNDFSHHYQHLSVGAELIGMAGAGADAEIMAMAVLGAASQGIDDWHLTIGHTGLMRQALAHFELDARMQRFLLHQLHHLGEGSQGKEHILAELDRSLASATEREPATEWDYGRFPDVAREGLSMGGRTHEEIAYRLAQKRKRAGERDKFVQALDFLAALGQASGRPDAAFSTLEAQLSGQDKVAQQILSEWRETIHLLECYDIPQARITIQPGLARTWEYYTGVVFELRGAGLHLGGGGRYDELTRLIGGQQDVPAVGFAYYMDALLNALPSQKNNAQTSISLVAEYDSGGGARWAQRLRGHDLKVELNPSNQLGSKKKLLSVVDDATIRFEDTIYSLDQLPQLIEDLKRID